MAEENRGIVPPGQQPAERGVSKILDQHPARFGIPGVDGGHAESEPFEMQADAHEWRHALAPTGGIHDDGAFPLSTEAEVAPDRGVAGERLARGPAPARALQ